MSQKNKDVNAINMASMYLEIAYCIISVITFGIISYHDTRETLIKYRKSRDYKKENEFEHLVTESNFIVYVVLSAVWPIVGLVIFIPITVMIMNPERPLTSNK